MSKKVLLLRLVPPAAGLASAELYWPAIAVVSVSLWEPRPGVGHSRAVEAGQEAQDGDGGTPASCAVATLLGAAVQG